MLTQHDVKDLPAVGDLHGLPRFYQLESLPLPLPELAGGHTDWLRRAERWMRCFHACFPHFFTAWLPSVIAAHARNLKHANHL